MKRRAWLKSVVAIVAAAFCPWMKRAKAVDNRDQTVRISQLRDRITFGWINVPGRHFEVGVSGEEFNPSTDGVVARRLLALDRPGDASSAQLHCDALFPETDGKYRTASVAIEKRLAQTMDDKMLCRKLEEGLLRSAAKGHRVGLLVPDPPPEWITKGAPA